MANLLNLPPELITRICSHLCIHCYAWHSSTTPPEAWYNEGCTLMGMSKIKALAALSLTCKTLRIFAQPYLYHFPSTILRFPSLLRTLACNKDLASNVRHLAIRYWDDEEGEQLLAQHGEMIHQLAMEVCHDAQGNLLPTAPGWFLDRDSQPRGIQCNSPELMNRELLANLGFQLVPNLERLYVETKYDSFHGFYHPDAFQALTELVIENRDTEFAFDLDDFKTLLAAAPKLHTLRGIKVSGIKRGLYHDAVKELRLKSSCMDSEAFTSAMEAFPQLERFFYNSGGVIIPGRREATPGMIEEAILIKKATLKHLEVQLDGAAYYSMEGGSTIHSLKAMQVLETLKLDSDCLYDEIENESTTDGTLLTNLLPGSLRSFELARPNSHIYQDIAQLARVADDVFPNLERVRISGTSRQKENKLRERLCDTQRVQWLWGGGGYEGERW
ncbi:hypothetical protein FZEAL_349 [Fusarium zealandicum]|uniref:Uncharacterized protein n=1 Tax=Fusarium zealandicum TaxID=1053134 RepID=A0A8H4UVM6_9HYPO|nr:hypothetical protein FZEAL_349 [Fusarium zealandicum]